MNTVGTGTLGSSWRAKYFSSNLQRVLRNRLVAEAVCDVDRSDDYYIHNPYSNQPTALQQGNAGTYSVSAWTITDDTLSKTEEAIYGEHVFDFERKMNSFDLVRTRMDEMAYAVRYGIDKFVINALCEDATGTYTTPAGGFTTSANISTIFSNLVSKVAGYDLVENGMFIILENTDITGVLQAQVGTAFSYADAVARNGLFTSYMGVDIYVVRSGTYVSATIGTRSDFTNSGHRVFGVKKAATYSLGTPVFEEKGVSGKTGKEIAYGSNYGFKFWAQMAGLGVDITIA